MNLKQALHDRLWRAFQKWEELRTTGVTKRDLKFRGLRERGDVNHYLRPLIFTGNTMRTYEAILRRFVDSCPQARSLEDIGKREFKAFIQDGMERCLAAKTLKTMCSALAKFGSLTGQTSSFTGLARKFGDRIRSMVKDGRLRPPSRRTPSGEVLARQLEVLKEWDARHYARTDEPRAYHLARSLQWETACRAVSATERMTAECLLPDGRVVIVGKGGRRDVIPISPELHFRLRSWFAHYSGKLTDLRGYECAYRRAILASGGRATGTHGTRRAAVQAFFSNRYAQARAAGLTASEASRQAAGDALERLGHSRTRSDHRDCYLAG
jgi:integrase